MVRPRSHEVIQQIIPPLAVWALEKVLEAPRVQKKLQEVDRKFYAKKRAAGRHATHNNRAWLAAGAAAFVLGLGLMARATKK